MKPYNNFSSMYSSYSQYGQNSFPAYQNSYPYHHQINTCQFSFSYNPYTYSSYKSYNGHTSQNSYIHNDQPYPSQEQSTQSSELHNILMRLQNDSVNKTKELQNSTETLERISALFDRISKQLDDYEEGETYEEEDNFITNVSDEEEESKMKDQDLSHQTLLDPIMAYESISQYNDGVSCKRDGDILSFSFKNIKENSKVPDLDFALDPYSLDYLKDDFISHCLNDEYDNEDDIISIDGIKIFDEEIKNDIPSPTIHETLDIEIEDKFDSHNLNAKDYDLDRSIEKDVEEPSIIVSTTHYTSEIVIYDESPLLEALNNEHHDPYMISTSNECHDPPIYDEYDNSYIISSIHKVLDLKDKTMTSDPYVLKDMKIIPDLGSTEKDIEMPPISLPKIPHTPCYQVHDGKIILENTSYEYHDPFLIERDTDHSFHIPPLSCMHHIFTKIPKIFSFTFIFTKIKNYKSITLNERFLPEKLDYIHWEDDFPIFILVYDLID